MSYFATITPTGHGWRATFSFRSMSEPSPLLPSAFPITFDLLGMSRWRRSRVGIERAAARVIRHIEAADNRAASSYQYNGREPR